MFIPNCSIEITPKCANMSSSNLSLQCFAKYPNLHITPFPNSVSQRHCNKSLDAAVTRRLSKDELEIRKLENQLPLLRDHFQLLRKVGEGTYSAVYLAKSRTKSKLYAVKHLAANFNSQRLEKELKFMQMIGGQDNVVTAYNCLQSTNSDCAVFIMPYLEHKRFSEYVLDFDANELRLYLKNLFIALKRVHSFNVIHRDVKPGNFLYNRETKEFLLVDFGLAQVAEEKKSKEKQENEAENMPIDYSKKRKRRNTDDEQTTPPKKQQAMSPFKAIENILTPLKQKIGPNSSSSSSSSSRKKLFEDAEKLNNGSPVLKTATNVKKGANLSRCLLKTQTELKLVNTPRGVPLKRSFTPINPSNTFVQVRNSQVVKNQFGECQIKKSCQCAGDAFICSGCQSKRAMVAPRAGTPGFRPPEVLLKSLHQTTAVDMWAAGVIMLCILSGCYPFFKSPSDLAGLTEIITLFGTQAIAEVAEKFGRKVCCSITAKGINLRKLCQRLRARKAGGKPPKRSSGKRCEDCRQLVLDDDGCLCLHDKPSATTDDTFPDSAYHLLMRLLDLDPSTRITAADALQHPFLNDCN